MEEIIEQPQAESLDNSLPKNASSEQLPKENSDGSISGKFKDVKTLLDAYNALQGEFTRKSQILSKLQKDFEDEKEQKVKDESIDDVLNGLTDSEKYKKEIEETLSSNKEIDCLPNKYRVAFETIKCAENKVLKTLNSQDFYDKYIATNGELKEKIINEYLSKLNNVSLAPKMMTGNSTSVTFSPLEKPKTMKEASEIFKKMLK